MSTVDTLQSATSGNILNVIQSTKGEESRMTALWNGLSLFHRITLLTPESAGLD